MSFSVNGNNSVNQIFDNKETTSTSQSVNTSTNTTPMAGDSVNVASYSTAPLPTSANTFKKLSNSINEMFSNVADKLGFGQTRKLINQEFTQVDNSKNGSLNFGEFNVATLNLFDFTGAEFARADKNGDRSIDQKEYANYRKEQLSNAFDRKETSGDNHLNVNEVGFIGQQLLANRDVRLDANQDGLVNKTEFTRSVVKGTMNIRDFLGS